MNLGQNSLWCSTCPSLPDEDLLTSRSHGTRDALKTMLRKLGLTPERFLVEYVSAAEGIRYAEVIKEIDAYMKAIGKEKIQAETATLKPVLDNMLKRWEKTYTLPLVISFLSFGFLKVFLR
jgi:hypothetical protein